MKIDNLTREAFSEFGDVISLEGAHHFSINNGTTERYHDLARIDVSENHGEPLISLFRSQPRHFPFEVTGLERHPLSSQAFFPLSINPYLVVVGPRGELEMGGLFAFLARPDQGVNYARGVWHHALIALNEVSDFIVVDRGGPGPNCDEVQLARPVRILEQDLVAAGLRSAVGTQIT